MSLVNKSVAHPRQALTTGLCYLSISALVNGLVSLTRSLTSEINLRNKWVVI